MRMLRNPAQQGAVNLRSVGRFFEGVTLGCAALLFLGCPAVGGEKVHSLPQGQPNILLISIDTLRADHLGTYGYSRQTSPAIDTFADQATVYRRAHAPSPWTLPSHAGMLTGIHPIELEMKHRDATMPASTRPVADYLRPHGYATVAFVDSAHYGFVGSDRGFGRGFDEYHHAPHRPDPVLKYDIAATVEAASNWLATRDPEKPFFMFLHSKSVHAVPLDWPCYDDRCFPYDQPDPFRFRFVSEENAGFPWSDEERGSGQKYLWSINGDLLSGRARKESFPQERFEVLKALYDGGIFYTDTHLGHLFSGLVDLGLWENTLIILTSDHGEAFLEQNLIMHQEVYGDLLRVPLIVKQPGQEDGAEVKGLVSLMDVMPTILAAAKVEIPPSLDGIDLAEDTAQKGRTLFAYYIYPPVWDYRAYTVFDDSWKVVRHNFFNRSVYEHEVYDLREDPQEQRPLAAIPEDARVVVESLQSWIRIASPDGTSLIDLPPEAMQSLQAIGYVD